MLLEKEAVHKTNMITNNISTTQENPYVGTTRIRFIGYLSLIHI